MARDKDIFTCDISLFNINFATEVSSAEAVTTPSYTDFINAFTNCRFNGEVEIASSDAAHDIESANYGIGRHLSVYKRWSVELGAVVDTAMSPALFFQVAFGIPGSGGTGSDQQRYKYQGFVQVVIQRRGGTSSGHVQYSGKGWFTAAEITVNEGAITQTGTIDGYGPLYHEVV